MYALGVMLFELANGCRYRDQTHSYGSDGVPELGDGVGFKLLESVGDDKVSMEALIDGLRACWLDASSRPTIFEMCDSIGVAGEVASSHSEDRSGSPLQPSKPAQALAASGEGTIHDDPLGDIAPHLVLREHAPVLNAGVTCVGIGPQGRLLLGFGSGHLQVWSWNSFAELQSEKPHTTDVTSFRYCDEVQLVVSCSEDGACIIWNWDDAKQMLGSRVTQFSMDTDLEIAMLTAAAYDGGVFLGGHHKDVFLHRWDGTLAAQLESPRANSAWIRCLEIHKPSRRLVAGCDDGAMLIFDLDTTELLHCVNEVRNHRRPHVFANL
jgi:WD40 repeat protein